MKKLKPILAILGIVIGIYFLFGFINSFFGWYGYEKWKYRRVTRGDLTESKERNVFIKNLEFELVPKTDSLEFNAFIENGFTYGKHSSVKTELIKTKTDFPFQVSFSQKDTLNKITFDLLTITKMDSMDYFVVYLRKPELNDTIYLKIRKWENKIGTDSIGFIKIYDKNNSG